MIDFKKLQKHYVTMAKSNTVRPILNNIYTTDKGYSVATDSHVMLINHNHDSKVESLVNILDYSVSTNLKGFPKNIQGLVKGIIQDNSLAISVTSIKELKSLKDYLKLLDKKGTVKIEKSENGLLFSDSDNNIKGSFESDNFNTENISNLKEAYRFSTTYLINAINLYTDLQPTRQEIDLTVNISGNPLKPIILTSKDAKIDFVICPVRIIN